MTLVILGVCGNKVTSVDICETCLNWGRGVINMSLIITLTSLDRVEANQNFTLLSLLGKIAFQNLLIFKKGGANKLRLVEKIRQFCN